MGVLDDGDYEDSFVAPTSDNSRRKKEFSRINWSDVGSQIGKESAVT